MGNTTSCAPCTPSFISIGVVKVLFMDGTVEEYTRPVNAGELMLENPRNFVCDASDLKVGHRIPGLTAYEDLLPRRLYLLLPTDMIYSVLTSKDMHSLSHKASRALKPRGPKNIARIFPVFSELCIFHLQIKPSIEQMMNPTKNERLSKQRSWRPALDTIIESPCML
ncbi:hypothetical protein AAC387_Pa10g1475 [Persea americana]